MVSVDARAGIRDTMRWLDRISDINRPARFDLFLDQYGDVRLREAADQLLSNVASGKKRTRVPAMPSGLAAARDRWHKARRTRQRGPDGLPGLNSGSVTPFHQSGQ